MNNETLYTYKFTVASSAGTWVFHHDFWSPMDARTESMLRERYGRTYHTITIAQVA